MIGFEVEVKWFRLLWSQGTSQDFPSGNFHGKKSSRYTSYSTGVGLQNPQDATLRHHVYQGCSTFELFV